MNYKVTNRSTGYVYYTIPEMNINREYRPKETKQITAEEIRAVCQQDGGRELFYNYLLIENEDILHSELNVQEEPEYWLTEEKIPSWINSCTLGEFEDALNFAPNGVKDLIKKYAIELPLNDMNKRSSLKKILDFDVTKSLEVLAPTEEEKALAEAAKKTTSRQSSPDYKVTIK